MTDYTIIKKWYGGYIPTFKTLFDFSIKSNVLTKEIILTPLELESNSETAYMADGKCILPALFFTEKFYDEYLGIEQNERILAAIAVINGTQIHESLHHKILGAKADFQNVFNDVRIRNVKKLSDEHFTEIFKVCVNIIEDVYSNYYCSQVYPNLNVFVDLLIKTMFNEKLFNERCNELNLETSVANVLNFLVCCQNDDNFQTEIQLKTNYQKHIDIILSARNIDLSIDDRIFIALELYELLKQKHNKEDGFDDLPEHGNFDEFDEKILESISGNIYSELKDLENEFFKVVSNDKVEKVNVDFIDVKQLPLTNNSVKLDKKFAGFSQYIQNARALKMIEVDPRYTGNKILISKLFMAESDSKFFAKKDTQFLDRNYPEIIFLLDCSGSMNGSGLLEPVINATMTIFKDLKENNISCAIYAHTTKENCLVIGVAANKMPMFKRYEETTHDYEQRFNRLTNIQTRENADGFALEFVSKRFSEKTGKKVVIILSDGQPSFGFSYGGNEATNHIQNICENLRKSNISVVSLSLTEHVMNSNNKIYGVKNNIAAYDNNLQSNMKKLIENIVI